MIEQNIVRHFFTVLSLIFIISKDTPLSPLRKHCLVVLQPFLMGCDTKNADIILLCLTSIQRLITHRILNEGHSLNINKPVRIGLSQTCIYTWQFQKLLFVFDYAW